MILSNHCYFFLIAISSPVFKSDLVVSWQVPWVYGCLFVIHQFVHQRKLQCQESYSSPSLKFWCMFCRSHERISIQSWKAWLELIALSFLFTKYELRVKKRKTTRGFLMNRLTSDFSSKDCGVYGECKKE